MFCYLKIIIMFNYQYINCGNVYVHMCHQIIMVNI